ncbi:DUF4123 domain-containing protein [Xanthomonas oryzae pv. oryzicola]|uniref:DUF4123 domain-containing protein n=1 Tax=Xanthomonas oryzae TaxID=347 RepID=UPI001033AF1F|nr:DUF4123 domain-containing protein [Xanthomonas oryzae]QBH01327.1 hypothetical protein EYC56_21270 [Xanthomonas oryzae]
MSPYLQDAAALCQAMRLQSAAAATTERWLILTGPAALEPFSVERLDALRQLGAAVVPVRYRTDRVGETYWPWLIDMRTAHDDGDALLTEAVGIALEDWSPAALAARRGHRIGGFLLSDAPLHAIADHLGALAVQPYGGQGSGQRLLGIADPAALEGIWRVCSERQRRQALGPISRWRTLDRWGQWSDQQTSAATVPQHGFLHFDPPQWAQLAHVRFINAAWAKAIADGHEVTPEQLAALPAALDRAVRHGVSDAQDLELFAWHALTVHPHFDLHPRIIALFEQRKPDEFYSYMVCDLDEEDWQHLRAGPTVSLQRNAR